MTKTASQKRRAKGGKRSLSKVLESVGVGLAAGAANHSKNKKKNKNSKRFLNGNSVALFGSMTGDASSSGKENIGYNPVSYPTTSSKASKRMIMSQRGDSVVVKGSDQIQTLNITTANSGLVLFSIDCNPRTMGAQRLQTMSTLYERYCVKKLNFSFRPSVSTFTAGQLLHFIEYDPLNELVTGDTEIVQPNLAAAKETNERFAIYTPSNLHYNVRNGQNLFTQESSSEDRLSSAGRYTMIANTDLSFSATTPVGTIDVEYEFLFYAPQSANVTDSGYQSSQTSVSDTTLDSMGLVAAEWNAANTAGTKLPYSCVGVVNGLQFVPVSQIQATTTILVQMALNGTSVAVASVLGSLTYFGNYVSSGHILQNGLQSLVTGAISGLITGSATQDGDATDGAFTIQFVDVGATTPNNIQVGVTVYRDSAHYLTVKSSMAKRARERKMQQSGLYNSLLEKVKKMEIRINELDPDFGNAIIESALSAGSHVNFTPFAPVEGDDGLRRVVDKTGTHVLPLKRNFR